MLYLGITPGSNPTVTGFSRSLRNRKDTLTLTVYSKPNCVQCVATYKALDKHGIEYEVIDITQDGSAMLEIKQLGYLQAPVVVSEFSHWSGFRPDKIEELA